MTHAVRNTVGLVTVLLLALVTAGLTRTLRLQSPQVDPGTSPSLNVEMSAAAARLASLVRLPTISWGDPSRRDVEAFDDVQQVLTASFPRVDRTLTRESIARWSLLYSWRGTRDDLPPIILTSHLDVVPVEPGTEQAWTHPPFAGIVADGSVWGRGTIDDKSGVAGLLEAAEALLSSGFTPMRTIYLAFGHNEEGGGDASGAGAIAASLFARGVRDAWLLDEGGLIYDQVPGVRQPVAFVGIAEKGYLNLEFIAHSPGGHSAMPPSETAVGMLARALDRVEHDQMPVRFDGAAQRMFETLAPDMSLGMRAAFANLWLTRPLLLHLLAAKPQTNALIRTTTAPTMLEGSPKPNVLAVRARAVVNFRLLPGDTAAAVEAHLRGAVRDDRIEIRRLGPAVEASASSATDTPAFTALARSIRAVYPSVLVAPYLTVAGTDTREYATVASNMYRFLPIYQHGALEAIHGTDEHVRVDVYEKAIRIYATIIKELAGGQSALR
jgi:carboxypeptidase PM20D1